MNLDDGPLLGLLALGLGALLMAAAVVVWWRARATAAPAARVRDRRSLDTLMAWQPHATRVLTSAEREAFRVLARAYPGHVILAQVPLARFLRVPTRHSYAEWVRRVGSQCADLVVCDAETQVLAVVAVRGKEPPSERALRRQSRMARVLQAAQIPLHLWSADALPTPEGVRRQLGLPLLAGESSGLAEPDRSLSPQREGAAPAPQAVVPLPDEVVELKEPPHSTWFDELDSGRVPFDDPKR